MNKFLFLLMVVVSTAAWGQTNTPVVTLTGTALSGTPTATATGIRYVQGGNPVPLGSRTYWIDKAYGLVKLSVPVAGQAAGGTATVVADITYQTDVNGVYVSQTSPNVSLSVNLQNNAATDVSYFLAPNAQYVYVQVKSITNTGLSGLTLTVSAVTEGFDFMGPADVPASLTHNTTLTSGGDLSVSWNPVASAESYELEWTFISNQGATPSTILTLNQLDIPPFYFKNNSSRVETVQTTYNIPLMYEQGYILYRVRAVGQNVINSSPAWVKSNWTYADAGSPAGLTTSLFPAANAYLYSGLENNINWQSSISFAEEGKNKAVVSYHDGSSRNRQAVTRINTDQRAIVGETFYDYNGRPIIQTLPVPVKNDSLGFYQNFNIVDGQTILRKEDITAVNPDACNPTGPQLSTNTGASNYYSPANTFGTNGNTQGNIINKDYIPDAKKYPYSQTVYTQDNTGRIATQSGVGVTNSLGSGKETKYLYGTPLQTELCRLFGSQVGYAAHYKKNVVMDPNGQTSVSYLDLDGKVVATALAGDAPGNVSALSGTSARTINEDLIKASPMSNALSVDGTATVFNKKFVVTSNNLNYTFNYTGTFGYYDILCKDGSSALNIDGVVDVYLTLQDKCGAILFSKNVSTVAGNTGQNQTVSISNVSAASPLNIGEYQLVKQAVLNEDKLNAYIQTYLNTPTCAKQPSDFQNDALSKIDLTDCNLTCATCTDEVNKLLTNQFLTDEQKEDIKNLCATICDNGIGCTAALNAMKADMTPGGQYAQLRPDRVQIPQSTDVATASDGSYTFTALDNMTINTLGNDDASNTIQPQLFPLSIFNTGNKIPLGNYLNTVMSGISSKEYWRYPIVITKTGDISRPKNYQILNDESNPITFSNITLSIGDYLDANGNIFYIYVQATTDPQTQAVSYTPAVADVSQLITVNQTAGLYKIPVRFVQNIADFENAWQTQWAYALMPYHPEFPYYIDCIAKDASNDFDYKMVNMNYADAKSQGLILSDGTPAIFAKEGDANAHVAPVNLYSAWMNSNIANYKNNGITLALLANQTVNCPDGTAPSNNCGVVTADCSNDKIDNDQEWTTYRSLYMSLKQEYIKEADMIRAVNGGYYNGCIGHANYISSPESWYFDLPKAFPVTTNYYSCSRFLFWKTSCGWHTSSYTVSVPSFVMRNQICFIGNAYYFKDKTQRFYPTGQIDNTTTQETGNCPQLTYDESGNPYVSPVPCAADLQALAANTELEAERLKYQMCGLCPVASDLQDMLTQLTANSKLVSSANTTLSCSNGAVVLGTALSRIILANAADGSTIYWSSALSADKKTISGSIKLNSAVVNTITLTIPASAATQGITFDQLSSLCCLSAITSGTFTIKATFQITTLVNGVNHTVFQDVYLNGTVDLDIATCTFPPKCVLTEDAVNTGNLLNILSSNGDLNTTTQLFDDAHIELYFDAILSLLKISDSSLTNGSDLTSLAPVWTPTPDGTHIIAGTLQYTLNGSQTMLIEVTASGSAATTPYTLPGGQHLPEQPAHFQSLSPVSYTSGCTACGIDFGAAMVSVHNDTYSVQQVVIRTPFLTPVNCTTIIPATVNRQ